MYDSVTGGVALRNVFLRVPLCVNVNERPFQPLLNEIITEFRYVVLITSMRKDWELTPVEGVNVD